MGRVLEDADPAAEGGRHRRLSWWCQDARAARYQLQPCFSAKILNTQYLEGINKTKYALTGSDVERKAVQDCEDEDCEAARQAVYSANWPAIMEMIRTSNKRPDLIIRGKLIILWSLC